MKLPRFIFKLRQHRFHNQELVFQSLYKAQNLGFYKNIYADGLIEQYAMTVAKADAFASAGNFKRARQALGSGTPSWEPGMTAANKIRIALAAPSTLSALALLAEAHGLGWNLVIEDCPFTQRFVQPVARREKHRTKFAPFSLIPKLIRSASTEATSCLYVTFPDRPFDSIRGSIEVRLLGREYLLSIAEALLTRAPVDRVFRLVRTLVEVEHPAGGADTISGEEIRRESQAQADALEAAILDRPLEYLGWESLYSRSQMYFDLVNSNLRSFFLCLLRYSQLQGITVPLSSYAPWVEQLSRREIRV
jgi:hypothetical protein